MNARDLRNYANGLIDAGQGDYEVQFIERPFESEVLGITPFSTDTVNGTVTLSRETVPHYAGLASDYRPAP